VTRVLVVEDDPRIAEALQTLLARSGYDALVAASGPAGWQALVAERPDALLLDLSLPGLDGAELLLRAREAGEELPVIAVTADSAPERIVRLLELGADDYVVKPYRGPELIARLRAALRRVAPQSAAPAPASSLLALGPVCLDRARWEVSIDGSEVVLSRTEMRLLEVLLQQPNAIVPQDEIARRVWGPGEHLDRSTVKVNISRLRRRLDATGRAWGRIRSAPGVGWGLFER
jgi:DNA-binding response OmpR family regulator